MRGNTFSLDILQLAIARRHGLAQIASFDERLRDAAAILGFEVLPARS
jgi:predicted nucleic acid-binding protein